MEPWVERLMHANDLDEMIKGIDAILQQLQSEGRQFGGADDLIDYFDKDFEDVEIKEFPLLVREAFRQLDDEYNNLEKEKDKVSSWLSNNDPVMKEKDLRKTLGNHETSIRIFEQDATRATNKTIEEITEEDLKRHPGLLEEFLREVPQTRKNIGRIQEELRTLGSSTIDAVKKKEIETHREQLEELEKKIERTKNLMTIAQAISAILINKKIQEETRLSKDEFNNNYNNDPQFKLEIDKRKEQLTNSLDELSNRHRLPTLERLKVLLDMLEIVEEGGYLISQRLEQLKTGDPAREHLDKILKSDTNEMTFTKLKKELEAQIQYIRRGNNISSQTIAGHIHHYDDLLKNMKINTIPHLAKIQKEKPFVERLKTWLKDAIKFKQSAKSYVSSMHSALSIFRKDFQKQADKITKQESSQQVKLNH